MRVGEPIVYGTFDTGLGVALVAASPRGVCAVAFGDESAPLVAALSAHHPSAACMPLGGDTAGPMHEWLMALRDALARPVPSVAHLAELPLDQSGTAFQQAVWQQLRAVPAGQIVTYSALAQAIGAPRSVRAVGSACGANQLALLIPCHRALRQDGQLGGYRWGLDRKAKILDWERAER